VHKEVRYGHNKSYSSSGKAFLSKRDAQFRAQW